MGMYTQVCGVLNVSSIERNSTVLISKVSKILDEACEKATDYWTPEQVRSKFSVLYGGTGSVFIALTCQGKIIGYSKDFENVICELAKRIPSLEGKIEWIIDGEDADMILIVQAGKTHYSKQEKYRIGFGNEYRES